MSDIRDLRLKNPTNVLISYLNINSLRYKFSDLKCLIGRNFDVVTIAETKLDSSFLSSEFSIAGYQYPPFRFDCSSNSGGLLTFVKK